MNAINIYTLIFFTFNFTLLIRLQMGGKSDSNDFFLWEQVKYPVTDETLDYSLLITGETFTQRNKV